MAIAITVAAVVAIVAAQWGPSPDPAAASAPAPVVPGKALPEVASSPRMVAPGTATPAATTAPAWRGTQVDGDIHIDANGHVQPDLALRHLFDYVLSGLVQIDAAAVRRFLTGQISQRKLTPAQSAEILDFFDRYDTYLDAGNDTPGAALPDGGRGADLASLRSTYQTRHDLRVQMLGVEMADGFFDASERLDRAELDRLAIAQDPTLSPDERTRRLQALAPGPDNTALLWQLSAQTATLQKQGADPGQIQAARVQLVGAAAAERLQDLDREQLAWNQRMESLRREQAQTRATAGLTAVDQQKAIDALIERDFHGPEAARARALLASNRSAG